MIGILLPFRRHHGKKWRIVGETPEPNRPYTGRHPRGLRLYETVNSREEIKPIIQRLQKILGKKAQITVTELGGKEKVRKKSKPSKPHHLKSTKYCFFCKKELKKMYEYTKTSYGLVCIKCYHKKRRKTQNTDR